MKDIIRYAIVVFLFCSCSREDDPQLSSKVGIRLVTPALALAGDQVVITGTNFGADPSKVTVAFEDQQAEVISASDSEIRVTVPPKSSGKETAKIQVKVGDRISNQFLFRYDYPQPVIVSFPEGVREGTTIEIIGRGFGHTKEDVSVTFGEVTASIVSVTDQMVTLLVPVYAGKSIVDIQLKVRAKNADPVTTKYTDVTYRNPVSARSLPDPTVIKSPDGWFYLYATEDTRNMPIMRSRDLTVWTYVGTAFTETSRPVFEPGGGLWAPDINRIDGKYVLYYSMSVWGGEWTCGVGVAVADNPEGPFTDRGRLFRSNEIGVQNSIDPFFMEDNGKKYLLWGSFRGIYMIELTSDGLAVKQDAVKHQIAGTYFEGVYVHKRGNYYYMFASIGSCCNGPNSTYQLVVGRATNLAGPYVNKSGTPMLSNGYSLVISKNASFVGNGHCSQIIQDEDGKDWMLYHGIRTSDASGRVLLLDQIQWDDAGWPYIAGGTPSLTAPVPIF